MRKTTYFYCLVILLSHISLLAQDIPEYLVTMHFEDAKGNRDSVQVGYDKDADNRANPNFGEIFLTEPFDSIFEIRASHRRPSFGAPMSKLIVSAVEGNNGCYASEFFEIYAWAKYPPLRISWDSLKMNTHQCNFFTSIFSPYNLDAIDLDWAPIMYCLNNRSEIIDSRSYLDTLDRPSDEGIVEEQFEVQGLGLQYIAGYKMNFFDFDACMYETTSTVELDGISYDIALSPNPVQQQLRCSLSRNLQAGKLYMRDLSGALVAQWSITESDMLIDLPSLQSGCYIMQVLDASGRLIHAEKLLKM